MSHHLAQVNIGRIRAPMDSPIMAPFARALDEINALAEASPGFVWRLKDDSNNATSLRPYDDPLTLVNLSVWSSVEALREFTYRSMHGKFFARRREWFEPFEGPHLALWWIPIGAAPTVEEAKERLAILAASGETEQAFTFRRVFPPSMAA
jgi:hypothetical protein